MPDRAFIDTNIFVYLASDNDDDKKDIAKDVINHYDCVISTQVTNELSNVLIKKFSKTTSEVETIISAMEATCEIALLTSETTRTALAIHNRYGYSFYDSLILASALDNNCRYVISEDLQGGQVINGKLTIFNPFW